MPNLAINSGSGLDAIKSQPDSGASGVYADAYKSAEKFDRDTEAGIQKMDKEVVPKPPTLSESPKPENYNRSSMEAFGSGASFLAMFGSLLTKHPLTTALNSGAKVMEAYHAQDAENFKQAMDKWKVDTDNAWKMADYQQQLYKDVIGKDEAELRARAVSAKDQVMLHMADAKMSEQLHRDRERNLKQSKSANQAISDYVDMKEQDAKDKGVSESEIMAQRPKWFGEALQQTKGNAPGETIDFSKLKPDDMVPGTGETLASIDQKVEGLKNGGSYPSVGVSMRTTKNPLKDAVDNRLSSKYPEFDYVTAQLEKGEKQKEMAAIAGRSIMAKTAVKEMDHLAQPMIDAVKKLDNSDYPDWNSVKNAYDRKTGGPDVIKAFQAVQDFKIAFDTLMTKNGASTDASRELSGQIANTNFSLDQIQGVRDQAKISGAAILDALAEVRGDITNDKSSGGTKPVQLKKVIGNKTYNQDEHGDWYESH